MRALGLSPDDASNLAPTPDLIQAKFDRMREQQDAFVASINDQLPDMVSVIPWAMVPATVWSMQYGDFLSVTCDMYPSAPWNMMLLPEDQRSALVLELPEHLHVAPSGFDVACNAVIGRVVDEFQRSTADARHDLLQGKIGKLGEFEAARQQTLVTLCHLAYSFGQEIYGEDAFDRHKSMFGDVLGWRI
ncbi:MAG: hypothetical protein ABJN26_07590 [Stappiaceae bacterium]